MSKFHQGKLRPDQGKFREKSGNLIFKIVWPPCKEARTLEEGAYHTLRHAKIKRPEHSKRVHITFCDTPK